MGQLLLSKKKQKKAKVKGTRIMTPYEKPAPTLQR